MDTRSFKQGDTELHGETVSLEKAQQDVFSDLVIVK